MADKTVISLFSDKRKSILSGGMPLPSTEPYEDPTESDLAMLNESHAVIHIGGKTRVVTLGASEEYPAHKMVTVVQTLEDFKQLKNKYRHEFIDKKTNEKKSMGLGSYWVAHPHRRQYDGGMAFMPQHMEPVVGDRLNLWFGFGVEPRKPAGHAAAANGADKFLIFMHDIICSGNLEHYQYLVRREALILQRRIRSEIALCLRTDEEGTGKGFYERTMGHLLGTHAMQINNPKHVIGAFNPHLETKLRVTADEALFVGNHEHRNSLFGLITEPKLTIEPKGLGVYTARNYLNISMTSNAAHFVPVGDTARRFFIPTVSAARMQDTAYFNAIQDQLSNEGGYEALLYHFLYEINLSGFDVRKVPHSAGLAEQAAHGRRGVDGLVELICNTGVLPGACHGVPGFSLWSGEDGFEQFINEHQDRELKGLALRTQRRLSKEWRCVTGLAARRRLPSGGRALGINWPELADLRALFTERFGPQSWSDLDLTVWPDPPMKMRR